MDHPARRRKQLAALLKPEQLDAILVSHPVNVTYLTGFSGESSHLIIGRQRTILVSDGRFTEQLAEECPGLETHIRPPVQPLVPAVAEVLTKLGFRTIGFESGDLTVAELEAMRELVPSIDWKPGRDRVEKLRVVKDESEVAEIREAIRIAERAFEMFRAMLRPDDTEKDLCDSMEMYIRRAGGRCSSFPSIIAVGPRAALPHAPPSAHTVRESELLLVDWGASGRFYKSDLTRVLLPRNHSAFARTGRQGRAKMAERMDAKLERIHSVVLAAQQKAIRTIRPGVKGHDVDAAARSVIDEAGFGKYFVHGLGHGLGLQVHEAPSLRAESKDVMEPGMVTTVEPGIYVPGWGGIRLEDDVLVTPDGCEVLTSVPKDLRSSLVDF